LQKSTKENRKEKRKGKKKKGPRGSLSTQTRNWPTAQPAPPPETVSSPFFSFADEWDPHVSTDIVINLRPKISPDDAVIFSY
jgi:hypothetical protein